MKNKQIIIFFTIVTILYNLLNGYVLLRISQTIHLGSFANAAVPILLLLLANFFFPSRRILHSLYASSNSFVRKIMAPLLRMLARASAIYLGFFSFALLLLLFTDGIIVINSVMLILPALHFHSQFATAVTLVTLCTAVLLTIISLYAAHATKIKKLHYNLSGKFAGEGSLNIAVVSDIHLGTVYSKGAVKKLSALINKQKADLVLFAGDILDESPDLVIQDGAGTIFSEIKSTYGSFAVPGNHEYFGGIEASLNFLRNAGITVLVDEAIYVADILLIGRDDRSGAAMKKKERKALKDFEGISPLSKPVIVLDHQPQNLDEAADARVTAQFSGHTHHAQMFPFSLITNMMYEKSWGYLKKKETHFYISCGFGTWGPPLRLGSHSEIVLLRLEW